MTFPADSLNFIFSIHFQSARKQVIKLENNDARTTSLGFSTSTPLNLHRLHRITGMRIHAVRKHSRSTWNAHSRAVSDGLGDADAAVFTFTLSGLGASSWVIQVPQFVSTWLCSRRDNQFSPQLWPAGIHSTHPLGACHQCKYSGAAALHLLLQRDGAENTSWAKWCQGACSLPVQHLTCKMWYLKISMIAKMIRRSKKQ